MLNTTSKHLSLSLHIKKQPPQSKKNIVHTLEQKLTLLFCFFSAFILGAVFIVVARPAFSTPDRRLVVVLLERVLRTNVAVVPVEESEMLLPVCC